MFTQVKVSAIEIKGGFISKVYKVEIHHKDATAPIVVVLKVSGTEYEALDKCKKSSTISDIVTARMHNRECDFYLRFADKQTIPLVKMYRIQKCTEGQPGALLMESKLSRSRSSPLYCGANVLQIFEVVKHISNFHKYVLSLDVEEWRGKYPFDAFKSFSEADPYIQFYEKLTLMKPGVFDQGIKVFGKCRKNEKCMRYIMVDVHKDIGLPAVLCHGDFWNNNILWKSTAENVLTNEIEAIIDWQCVHEGSMASDISRFLGVCTDADIRREYEDEVLRFYYDTISEHLKSEGRPEPFAFEQLRTAYETNFIHQAMICMIAGPLLIDCDDADGQELHVKQAQMEKLLLRAKLAVEDAIIYVRRLPSHILELCNLSTEDLLPVNNIH
uniref:CHK domain-containing protein n=1 Tax=Steinernema glaseri TaxID=37863 RepID=A0A1I7YJY1_9BILA